jgi:hypothetical protein
MTGNTRGLQIYLEAQQRASEKGASSSPPQSIESLRQQAPQDLTDEQLKMLILDNLKQQKQACGMGHLSNAEFIESRGGKLLPSALK